MGIIHPETVTTNRVLLLPLAVEHADEMAGVLSDPRLYTYIGGAPPTPVILRARYERLLQGAPDPAVSWCNWVLKLRDTGCLAGTVQATIGPGAGGLTAQIAWVVGTPWQGTGIAKEAAKALVAWLGLHAVQVIIAHIHPGNHASIGVAIAAGLAPTSEWHDGEQRWILRLVPRS